MKAISLLVILMCFVLAACNEQNTAQNQKLIGIVDMEQILRESAPALAADKHITAVRDILQKGVQELQQEWKDAPEAERTAALNDGLNALQRQMLKEEQAAKQVVLQLLQDECEKWRAINKAILVTAKQDLLATDNGADITADIIAALNKRLPVFADLPTVSIKKREAVSNKSDKSK